MALVPADMLTQNKPANVQLTRLDMEMKKILEDDTLPADVKFKLYGHILRQHTEIESLARKPVEVPIRQVEQQFPFPKDSLMRSLPNSKKQSGSTLVDFLAENAQVIKFDDKNRLVVDGKPVEGSNLVDLVSHATRDKKSGEPVGWDEFYRLLNAYNVPRMALGNRYLREPDVDSAPPSATPTPTATTSDAAAAAAAAADDEDYATPPGEKKSPKESAAGHRYHTRSFKRKSPGNQRGKGFRWTPLYK